MSGQRYDDIGLADYIPELSSKASLIDSEVFELHCLRAIVDPISAESHRLNKGSPSKVRFKPMEPPIRFFVAMLSPKHRARSLIAQQFADRLRGALQAIHPSASPATGPEPF